MEIRKYSEIIFAYRWPLILIPLIAALVAYGATYVVSPRFVGTAVIQLIPDDVEPRTVTLRAQDGPNTVALGLTDPTELLAQGVIENLGTTSVAQLTADALGVGEEAPPTTGWQSVKAAIRRFIDDAWDWLRYGYVSQGEDGNAFAERVRKSVKADLIRGSYYMEISATWNDPETAADIANASVEALLTHSRQVATQAAAERRQFLETQVNDAKQRLDAARAAVLQYSRDHGVVADASVDLALNALESTRVAKNQNEIALADVNRRLSEIQEQLATTDQVDTTVQTVTGNSSPDSELTVRTTSPNPVYQTVQQQQQNLQQEMAAMETRQGHEEAALWADFEKKIKETQERLTVARQQLEREPKKVSLGMPNPTYHELEDQVHSLEQELQALSNSQDQMLAELRTRQATERADIAGRLSAADSQLAAEPPELISERTESIVQNQSSSVTEQSSPNPVYQSLQQQLLSNRQEQVALTTRQEQLNEQLAAREQEFFNMTGHDATLAALQQDLSLASDVYNQRTAQWHDAQLEEARPVSQVRLIEAADVPEYPVWPIKIYWALIGLAAGLVVAGILVFVRYSTNLSLRSAREAQEVLDLDMLAIVPNRSTVRVKQ